MLTSLFELKSPKFSLHSREKVFSFTTNVIFLENKNIKWPKKKKPCESLMPQSQTKILDGAWERNPTLGSLAGPPAVVLAAVEPSESVCLWVHCQRSVWSTWTSKSNMILILRDFCPCLSWRQPSSISYIYFLLDFKLLFFLVPISIFLEMHNFCIISPAQNFIKYQKHNPSFLWYIR